MALTLIGSYTSPYVRKMRLLLWNDKSVKFEPLNYFEEAGNKLLKETSPINQLPILMDGDQPIYETRVMYNYLAKKHNYKPLTIEEENILSAIDACLNSGINLFPSEKAESTSTILPTIFWLDKKNGSPRSLNSSLRGQRNKKHLTGTS